MRVHVTTITGANLSTVNTNIAALAAAIANLIKGNLGKSSTIANSTAGAGAGPSTVPEAQRENKYLVRYHDSAGRKFKCEIPTCDLSLLPAASEFLTLTDTYPAAFKTAFEAVVVSPVDDASAVTVDSIQFVGRRS